MLTATAQSSIDSINQLRRERRESKSFIRKWWWERHVGQHRKLIRDCLADIRAVNDLIGEES